MTLLASTEMLFSNHRWLRSRANLRPPSRSALVIDRLLKIGTH
jgi:hypothetical protein